MAQEARPCAVNANLIFKWPRDSRFVLDLAAVPQAKRRIHRKGKRGKPLMERGKSSNPTRSAVRARVEHVFAAQTSDMEETLVRHRTDPRVARIGMKNLACRALMT
ncbi:hypothetical protein EV216_10789 [Rhodovulum steppense]|uniref:DDE family transposase n=1 Tax=Rhodovulum steppense TaxID=540251 RepID=A0A4R1YWI9_9RHOB|nr:hypothetical protein EV216_10789 [Rhodovulum steppense]